MYQLVKLHGKYTFVFFLTDVHFEILKLFLYTSGYLADEFFKRS